MGLALMAIAATRKRCSHQRVLSVHDQVFCWRAEDKCLAGVGCSENDKRHLQGAFYPLSDEQPLAEFHEENRAWPPREDKKGSRKHSHGHGHEKNDDDDSDDDNNDEKDEEDDDTEDDDRDESEDDDKDEDGKDDKNSANTSQSSSASNSSDEETAAIQSSVVTNLDGVNIGNTITIINVGTGSQAGNNGPDDYEPNVTASGSLAVSASGRSAITAAAVRAFCDSIGCNPSNVARTPVTSLKPGGSLVMPSVNAARGTEAHYELPLKSSDSSFVTMRTTKWLLLIAILLLLCFS